MIVKTKVSDQSEQFEIDGKHYVGRRLLCGGLELSRNFAVLFRLDYDGGLIFVDPSLLRPFPSEKIEEPTK